MGQIDLNKLTKSVILAGASQGVGALKLIQRVMDELPALLVMQSMGASMLCPDQLVMEKVSNSESQVSAGK